MTVIMRRCGRRIAGTFAARTGQQAPGVAHWRREGRPMSTAARIVNPQYLVETDWLAAHLGDADLRVFDCTTYLDPDPVTVYVARSGRPEWEKGHIPGAGYLDLHGELSDTSSPLRFTMPPANQ